MIREPRREIPAVVHGRDVQLIEGRFAVDAGAGVAVPVPDAPEVLAYCAHQVDIASKKRGGVGRM